MSPEKVDGCAKSVMESNPDLSESQAFAICQEMDNEGELSANELAEFVLSNSIKPECGAKILSEERELDEEDPCWDGYTMVGMKEENGREVPNCVPDDDVPDADLSAPHILGGAKQLADRIEREKVDENTVRYNGIKALTEGVWTDQESREPIHYMPENLSVELGSDVNVIHDQSDVSESVEIVDYEHGTDAKGKDAIFLDFELDPSTSAGAYADDALKAALESDGEEGFGGPSVEIPPEGQDIRPNGPRDVPYTADGKIDGLGLVGQPAAKDTAFSYQTRERAVALSSGEDALMLEKEQRNMADAEELRETLEGAGIDTSDMEDEDVMDMAESLHGDLMEKLEMAEHGDEDDEEEEEKEMMDDDAREVMQDMIQEEMDDIWGSLDELKEDMAEIQSEMSEEMSAAREELAEAETVKELQEAKEDIDKRLSQIEEEPNNEDRTLAEGTDWDPEYDNTDVGNSPSW